MGAMDLTVANAMVQRYTETRRLLIDQTYKINDTKAIWFSMEQMQTFMASLTPDMSGVRVYLSVYGEDDPNYPNQTTIIAIGTVKDGSGSDVDPISQNLLTVKEGGGQDPYNHGSLCPPGVGCS